MLKKFPPGKSQQLISELAPSAGGCSVPLPQIKGNSSEYLPLWEMHPPLLPYLAAGTLESCTGGVAEHLEVPVD